MLQKEREELIHSNPHLQALTNDDQSEIGVEEVDSAIQEKEEILSKLMDTVKGYSTMKNEFEKLLDAINGLEMEKRELEVELEKAKKVPSNDPNTSNSIAVERIKDRFLKVKDELKKMRDERKNKENAYRLMQRESKQCEALQKELQKLKESKVSIIKQQKTQTQQLLKLKKDQAQRQLISKKTEVKKQQQMNTLKSELVKKDRVLGHKDREIGRINMKLKACEEHITQLLKIQNRNRSKTANGTIVHTNSNNNMNKTGLSNGEMEHLNSSKNMLDNIILDRVDRRQTSLLYEKKTKQLKDLNRDLIQEACDLEELIAEKKVYLREVFSQNEFSTVTIQQFEELEDEKDLLILLEAEGKTASSINEKVKYDIIQLNLGIKMSEANIERISKDVDSYNADLDDLSLKMERLAKNSNGEDLLESLCKDIINGLNLQQSHLMLWELVCDKANAMEQLRMCQDDMLKYRLQCETFHDRLQESMKINNDLRNESKLRLERAEKQRVQDVWAILNASSAGTSLEGAAEETALKISIHRSQDLERELESSILSEESLKTVIKDKQQSIESLARELAQVQLSIKISARPDKDQVDQKFLDKLLSIWDEVGVQQSEREEVINIVNKAEILAKERVVAEAEVYRQSLRKELDTAHKQLQSLCCALGVIPSDVLNGSLPSDCRSHFFDLPMEKQIILVSGRIAATISDMEDSFPVIVGAKDRLLDLVAEMWLEIDELPAILRPVLKINTCKNGCDDLNTYYHLLADQMCGLQISLKDFHSTVESELRKLNLDRVHLTTKLINLKKLCIDLTDHLGITERSQFDELLKPDVISSGGEGDQLSVDRDALSLAVQIITVNSASNPQGSSKLLTAFEKLKLILESVKVNRQTLSVHVVKYIEMYSEGFQDDSLFTSSFTKQIFQQWTLHMCSSDCIKNMFEVAFNVEYRSKILKESFIDRIISTLDEFTSFGDNNNSSSQSEMYRSQVSNYLTTCEKSLISYKVINNMSEEEMSSPMYKVTSFENELNDIISEMEGIEMFLEESWLRSLVRTFTTSWSKTGKESLRRNIRDVVLLKDELKRVLQTIEVFRELVKIDKQLSKHVSEMEDFELASKQDRAKALSGLYI